MNLIQFTFSSPTKSNDWFLLQTQKLFQTLVWFITTKNEMIDDTFNLPHFVSLNFYTQLCFSLRHSVVHWTKHRRLCWSQHKLSRWQALSCYLWQVVHLFQIDSFSSKHVAAIISVSATNLYRPSCIPQGFKVAIGEGWSLLIMEPPESSTKCLGHRALLHWW